MIKFIELENEHGTKVVLCNYGASIYDLATKDKNGNVESIVVRPDDIEQFKKSTSYFGKTVGRNSGRIDSGKFIINGKEYIIKTTDKNGLHGGNEGFSYQYFEQEMEEANDYYKVVYSYKSKDMECGFPGEVKVNIIYYFYKKINKLMVEYEAVSDKDTIMNLTNHSFFNLSGNLKRNILEQKLYLNASQRINLVDMVPTNIKECSTIYSFKEMHKIGDYILNKEIIDNANGYDFPYVFDSVGIDYNNVILEDEESGRKLTINTTYPVVVVYSCNYPEAGITSFNKQVKIYDAVCLECQYEPNNINAKYMAKQNEILKANHRYLNKIIYNFN